MNPLTFIKAHKLMAGLFGAAVAGYVLYSFLHKNSGGTASPVTGGDATTGSPQFLVPVIQGPDPGSMPSSPPLNPPNSLPTAPTPPTSQGAIVANAYPVGTKVTSHEVITQSIYDPLYHGWIDLTGSIPGQQGGGGLYGSGLNVSGSGYSPNWKGSGRIELARGGAQVQEFSPQGKLIGTFSVK